MGELSRADRVIAWIEEYCRVPDGKDAGKPVVLRTWQRDIIRQIYDNPLAITRQAIISFGRKNAKTTLAAMLLLVHLVGPEARMNAQLNSAAQSRAQAAVLFKLAAKMVRLNIDLASHIVVRDATKELFCPEIGTLYTALSAEVKTSFGLSPVFIVHDELGQVRGPVSDLYDALETAMGAHEMPLSIVISTQAANDDDLMSMLIDEAATGADPRTVLSLYTAPEDLDPFDPETQKLANPAYGDFLSVAEVERQAGQAERLPALEPRYRNLILNQRIDAGAPYVTPAIWKACGGPVVEEWPAGATVYAGLDLSQSRDLTAYVEVAWIGDEFHARPWFWIPAEGLADKARRDKASYPIWVKDGQMIACPGKTVDYSFLAQCMKERLATGQIARIAVDGWRWALLKAELERIDVGEEDLALFEKHPQGFRGMEPALTLLDEHLLNERLRHGGHPVLTMCAQNVVAIENATGARMLVKPSKNSTRRIDGIVALAMAASAAGQPMADAPKQVLTDEIILERGLL